MHPPDREHEAPDLADAPSALVHVVDDDPSVCVALGGVLRSEGYATSSFHSVEAYLNREDPREPDCVVVDLVMPGWTAWPCSAVSPNAPATRPWSS